MSYSRDLPIKKRILASLEESKPAHPSKHVKIDANDQEAATLSTQMPTTTALNSGIFKRPLPVAKKQKNPLRSALEAHFQNMNPATLTQFHYGEILRLIADFHRAKRHSFTESQRDMFPTILFLYEKSCILEPLNGVAKQNRESYQKHLQPQFSAPVFIEANLRNNRYLAERMRLGHERFFWLSIDKYIERLQRNYGKDYSQELAELCTHLASADSVVRMRNKHMTPDKQTIAIEAFNSSIANLLQDVSKESTASLSL